MSSLGADGRSPGRGGFTLIELLIVVAVISTLVTMLVPIMSMAQRGARRSATQALLGKVDAGLRMFKEDIGVHPYQEIDAADTAFPPVDNRLAYHLVHEMSDAERSGLEADAAAAAAAYDALPHGFTDTTPIIVANQSDSGVRAANAVVVNRMARERARLMMHAGHTKVKGLADNAGTQLHAGATTKGWGGGYLAGDIPAKNMAGDAIIDGDGVPLLYICPVTCGLKGVWAACPVQDLNNRAFYVQPVKFGLLPKGRDETASLASDMRTTAARAYAFTFELWSLGPDRRGSAMRSDALNRDNLPAQPYLKGLVP